MSVLNDERTLADNSVLIVYFKCAVSDADPGYMFLEVFA